jgi:hypothetical protein
MENKYEQLKSDVYDEIDAIEQTIHDLSSLKTQIALRPIDNIQKAAIGTFLMNFFFPACPVSCPVSPPKKPGTKNWKNLKQK